MFNKALLNTELQEFITNFEGDIRKLAFTGTPFKNVSVQELIQQIEGRRKTEKKLPTWYGNPAIIFPPRLNLEQTSSEITAKYKAGLLSGKNLADITGGFGVDAYFFAKNFETVHHFEINKALSDIAAHNFEVLGVPNIKCHDQDGLESALNGKYHTIFADPCRRHDTKGKVFFLKDCTPNIPENIDRILQNCKWFLLKTSPMLDISIGLQELGTATEIHIIAIENEVKELLWLLKKNNDGPLKIKTVNFTKSKVEQFDFDWNKSQIAEYNLPQTYLYEPNAAILKSGAFDLVSEKLDVDKLHKNTHLFTNDVLIDFPGRRFLIERRVPYSKAEMRKALNFKKANISVRNFPESVDFLRKKWKIAEGGDIYLFFVTNTENKKEMLLCSKI